MTLLPAAGPLRAIAFLPFPADAVRAGLAALPGLEVTWAESKAALAAGIAAHDAAILGDGIYGPAHAAALAQPGRRTRWVALFTAGYGNLVSHGIPDDVVITHASPAWAPTVAEHAVALLQALLRQVPLLERQRAARLWDRELAGGLGALEDETVMIVGSGGIGQAVARRLLPSARRLVMVSRSAKPDGPAGPVHPLAALPKLLPECSSVVLTIAHAPETHHLFDAALLARLPHGARLVNVARGGLVDTAALIAALASGALAGAALDVAEEEPLPAEHPLWLSDRLILSPHVAAFGSKAADARLTAILIDNFARALAGQTLRYVVTER